MSLLSAGAGTPFADAVAGGAAADRLGLAFVAGYQAALRALVPSVGPRRAALCATEEGSAHPKSIRTTVAGGRVTGRKGFVTFGAEAQLLLVVAREPGGALRLAVVDPSARGVKFEALSPLRFAPEVPHAALVLDAAPAELLPGDGYDDYLKPFRTVEDVHVFGAALAYLFGAGRRARWPGELLGEIAALVAALATLAAEDPRARETHLVLGGVLALGRSLIGRLPFDRMPDEERARWARDRPLLAVADAVRAQRLAGAVSALGL